MFAHIIMIVFQSVDKDGQVFLLVNQFWTNLFYEMNKFGQVDLMIFQISKYTVVL